MFDAKVDFNWARPLLTRSVDALESMADSLKLLAVTAQLQAKMLETHPHNQDAQHGPVVVPPKDGQQLAPGVASVTPLRSPPKETRPRR